MWIKGQCLYIYISVNHNKQDENNIIYELALTGEGKIFFYILFKLQKPELIVWIVDI